MTAQLDETARDTIFRFGLKLGLSALIASTSKTSFILSASGWIALYSIVTVAVAILRNQPLLEKSFNHWDEATWLTTVSLGLWVFYKASL